MAGFFRSALAIANLCLWPPERLNLPTKKDQQVLSVYFMEHLTWCIEALGHPPHKVAICFQRGSLDLFPRGALISVGDVGGDRSRKHDRILRYQTNNIAP